MPTPRPLRSSRRPRVAASVGALAAILASTPTLAVADPPARELRHDVAVDAVVTGTIGAAWIASELLKSTIAPRSCRACDRGADGLDALNPIDRSVRAALRWERTGAADAASYVTGFALSPIVAYGGVGFAAAHDGHAAHAGVDALLVTEAVVVAAGVNQLVKLVVARERPFVHALSPAQKRATSQPSDNDLSFFSGHTTLAFSLAAASGTVASMRGYRLAPLLWASGLGLGVVTGELRLAADRHYFTDVITGAVVGAAIGVLIPLLAHPPVPPGAGDPGGPPGAPASAISFAGRF